MSMPDEVVTETIVETKVFTYDHTVHHGYTSPVLLTETSTTTVTKNVVKPRIRWDIGPVTERTKGTGAAGPPRPYTQREADAHMNLGDSQQTILRASGADRAGNAVTPASLTVSSSDETIVTVADNGDGTWTATAVGTLGSAVVTAVDTETDGSNFSGSLSFDVVPEGVAAINLTADTPTEKP